MIGMILPNPSNSKAMGLAMDNNTIINPFDFLDTLPSSKEIAPRFELKPFKAFDPVSIPKRQWLYGAFLQRGSISATVAPGGVGKSTLVITDAIALATGKTLVHLKPKSLCKVALWNGEDSQEELNRRIAAICQFYEIDMVALEGQLFLAAGYDSPFKLTIPSKGSQYELNESTLSVFEAFLKANTIDAVFIDPFIAIHHVEENNNVAIDAVMKALGAIADRCQCAIHIVHHTNKSNGLSQGVESARGASSFHGACRAMRILSPMSKEDAKTFEIDDFDPYASIVYGKGNFSKKDSKKQWIELQEKNECSRKIPES
jgi:Mrp family chromosome partitioning ATPase